MSASGLTTRNSINGVTLRVPSDDLQHIQFEGCDVCVIAPEDYDALQFELTALRLSSTARERQLAVANKLWQLCVKEDFPWADGSTQDALTELGLLYAKDMTDEDPSERCKNCDDDCSTCYRAVERIEDAAMEKANG